MQMQRLLDIFTLCLCQVMGKEDVCAQGEAGDEGESGCDGVDLVGWDGDSFDGLGVFPTTNYAPTTSIEKRLQPLEYVLEFMLSQITRGY